MTAHLVLLAQTKVGCLSGGRSKPFHKLSPDEQQAQREEAYARATVALTRAQTLCVILGPLDMRGVVGAATVIGCLKYGAGFCGLSSLQRSLRVKEQSILAGPDDAAFLSSLRRSLVNARGVYPPVALAEIYIAYHDQDAQIRRLHLVVVDLDQPRHLSRRVLQQFADLDLGAARKNCMNALPISHSPLHKAAVGLCMAIVRMGLTSRAFCCGRKDPPMGAFTLLIR